MIIYTHQKSKKRKPTAKQRELAAQWEELVKKYEPKKPIEVKNVKPFVQSKPFIRETPKYPSLMSMDGSCTKPIHGKKYTGDKLLGIGTLHKSNAVPIFSQEEAQDQAKMRR